MVIASQVRASAVTALIALVLLLLGAFPASAATAGVDVAAATTSDAVEGDAVESQAVESQEADPGPVVMIGVPGLSWSDITERDTPAMWALAQEGATANLSVRSTYFTSCPADGWLGFSAGNRAAEPRDLSRGELRSNPRALPDCAPLPEAPATDSSPDDPDQSEPLTATPIDEPGWRDLSDRIADQAFDARIGQWGQAAADADMCVGLRGQGVLLGAPDLDGALPAHDGDLASCPLSLVGAPPITTPDDGPERVAQVEGADDTVADAVDGLPEDATVLVAGLSDDGGMPGFRALIAAGPAFEVGTVRSDSTGRVGLAQVSDLTYTTLALAGLTPPDGMTGRMLTSAPTGEQLPSRRAALVEENDQLVIGDAVIPPFFRAFGYGLAALLVLAGLAHGLLPRTRPVVRRGLLGVAMVVMAMPVATFLITGIGWYSASRPVWSLAAVTAGAIAVVWALVALLLAAQSALAPTLTGRRVSGATTALTAVGLVGGITAVVLAGDLMVNQGRASFLGVLGLHPLDGGRFHGFGNVPFALFVTGGLLAIIALVDPLLRRGRRREAVAVAAALGGLLFVIDAAPWLGADGGGALSIIPAVGYLVMVLSGVRGTWGRLLGLGAATGLGFLAIAGLDWLRPEADRTHLGRFFDQLLAGEAFGVIVRKLETNVDMLFGPERAALLVPVGLLAAIAVLARPASRVAAPLRPALASRPALRPGLIAILIALTAGFLLNDSGTGIPATGAIVLLPAVLLLVLVLRPAADPPAESRDRERATPSPR